MDTLDTLNVIFMTQNCVTFRNHWTILYLCILYLLQKATRSFFLFLILILSIDAQAGDRFFHITQT